VDKPAHPSLATFVASSMAALGVAAALFVYGRQEPGPIYSPAPLSSAHASITACSSCHVPWSGPEEARCATPGCHATADRLASGKAASVGLHATLTGRSCFTCHREHLGRDARIYSAFEHRSVIAGTLCRSCHAANVPAGGWHEGMSQDCSACHGTSSWSVTTFDHDSTSFPLTGAHVALRCPSCHGEKGSGTKPRACVACHQKDDKHKGGFGPDCARCHSTTTFAGARFAHRFPIDRGAHSGLACASCHTTGDYLLFSCVSCHEHAEARMNGEHRGEVAGYAFDSQACYRCHPTGAKEEEGDDVEPGDDEQPRGAKRGDHDEED
jgi:hypothetical protein